MALNNDHGRRDFMQLFGLGAAAVTVPWLSGCMSDEDDVTPNPEWEKIAAEKEAKGVYTNQRPGVWRGEEGNHVPQVAFDHEAGTVIITAPHPMTPEHWITTIYIRNQDNIVIGMKQFLASEPVPIVTFPIPASTTRLAVYAHCNLHDDWEAGFAT